MLGNTCEWVINNSLNDSNTMCKGLSFKNLIPDTIDNFPDSEINPKLLHVIDIFLNAKYDMWAIKETLIPISREIIVSTVAEQKDKIRTHNFLFLPSTDSEEILDKINT